MMRPLMLWASKPPNPASFDPRALPKSIKGGAAASQKVREKKLADALAVDFTKKKAKK